MCSKGQICIFDNCHTGDAHWSHETKMKGFGLTGKSGKAGLRKWELGWNTKNESEFPRRGGKGRVLRAEVNHTEANPHTDFWKQLGEKWESAQGERSQGSGQNQSAMVEKTMKEQDKSCPQFPQITSQARDWAPDTVSSRRLSHCLEPFSTSSFSSLCQPDTCFSWWWGWHVYKWIKCVGFFFCHSLCGIRQK